MDTRPDTNLLQTLHLYIVTVLSDPPRLRSNSVAVCTEEDVVFTSYGPVVLQEETSPRTSSRWLLGWLLAILSGILFTANNFLVKYYTIEAVDMLLVRSGLQTVLLALVIGENTKKFSFCKSVFSCNKALISSQ